MNWILKQGAVDVAKFVPNDAAYMNRGLSFESRHLYSSQYQVR